MVQYQNERNYGCRVRVLDSRTFRGVNTAILENELLRVVVLVDKGADIYQFVHKPSDVDFLWRRPWQTVFPSGGCPSQSAGADLGLHAEANLVPWDVAIVADTVERVALKCWVRTSRTPFYFEKTLSLVANTATLRIEQRLENEGNEPMHCVLGEHIAIGPPFLDEDCVIDLPGGMVQNHPVEFHPNNRLQAGFTAPWPMTHLKDGTLHDLSKVPGRSFASYDQSYISEMPAGWYGITNQRLEVGFGVSFPTEVYRYLWHWQLLGGGIGYPWYYPWYGRDYNVGIEPFSSYPNKGLATAVENGTALLLEPGGEIVASLAATAYEGKGIQGISPAGEVQAKQ